MQDSSSCLCKTTFSDSGTNAECICRIDLEYAYLKKVSPRSLNVEGLISDQVPGVGIPSGEQGINKPALGRYRYFVADAPGLTNVVSETEMITFIRKRIVKGVLTQFVCFLLDRLLCDGEPDNSCRRPLRL